MLFQELILSLCPGRILVDFREFHFFKSPTDTPCFFAIADRESPRRTVYVTAAAFASPWIVSRWPTRMTLPERPFQLRIVDVVTPWRRAISLKVSPRRTL